MERSALGAQNLHSSEILFRLKKIVRSIRTPMLIQGRLERTETNRMHFKWEVTWSHGNQPNTFQMG